MTLVAYARLSAAALVAALLAAAPARAADSENIVHLDLEYGRVVIELLPDLAPNHVVRFRQLVRDGFYDGLKFHRVIDGFMAQTGDPTGTGAGGSSYPNLPAEFSRLPFVRGSVGMARLPHNPHSANSQFFIVYAQVPWLDGEYTQFARVVSGMEFVDRLKKGRRQDEGLVRDPDIIVKMQLAADAEPKGESK